MGVWCCGSGEVEVSWLLGMLCRVVSFAYFLSVLRGGGVGCVSMLCLGLWRFFVVVWFTCRVLGVVGVGLGCVLHGQVGVLFRSSFTMCEMRGSRSPVSVKRRCILDSCYE